MRNHRKTIVGMTVAAALAASAGFTYAQPAGPGGQEARQSAERGGPGMHRGHGERRDHGKWSNPAAAVEGYLAALKVELKITPDQENAWQAFTGKVKQQADAMIARRAQMKAKFEQSKGQPRPNMTAPEQLAQRTERMKQRVAGMETMTVAVKDMYSVLTPEQKTIADRQLARGPFGGHRGGRGGHHGRGGFGGHGGHGGPDGQGGHGGRGGADD